MKFIKLLIIGSFLFLSSSCYLKTSLKSLNNSESISGDDKFKVITAPNLGKINSTNYNSVSFSGECADNDARISLDGGFFLSEAICQNGEWHANADFSDLPEGTGVVTFYYKTTNSTHEFQWSYTKDTVPPVLTWSTPAPGATINGSNISSLLLAGTCSEDQVSVVITGAVSMLATCNSGSWSSIVDLNTHADGSLNINIQQTDAAGNTNTPLSLTIQKLTAEPTVTLSGVPLHPSSDAALNVTVAGVGVVGYVYKFGVAASTDCTSAVGYSGSTIAVATLITDSLPGDNSLKLCVRGVDGSGNWQSLTSATSYTWTKDTLPPAAIISGGPSDPSSATALNVTVAGTDVVSYEYKVGLQASTTCSNSTGYTAVSSASTAITSSIGSDGLYRLCVIGIDSAGNKQDYTSATLHEWEKDASAPTAILAGTPGNPSSAAALNVTVSGTSILHYQYALGAGLNCSSATYSADIDVGTAITDTLPSDASLTLCVRGKNNLGTYQLASAATSYTWTKDTEPPTGTSISIQAGATYTNSTSVTLTLAATNATEMYITQTAACASGGSWETYNTSKSWTLANANQANTVYVKFRDAAHNESSCIDDNITHDNLAPSTPTITSPTAGAYVISSNMASISVTGACETGTTINISGALTGTTSCSSSAYSTTLDFSGSAEGSLDITISQTDPAGNTSTSLTRAVTKDTVSPSLSGSVNDGTYSTSTTATPTLTWTSATEVTSGILKYQLAIGTSSGGTETLSWTDIGTGTSYSHTTSLTLTVGTTYYPSVRAVDNAGNAGSAISGNGWLVTTPVVISPASLTLLTGESATFSASGGETAYTYADSGSGYLNTSTRVYTVPQTSASGTENVTVTDSLGQTSTVNVKIRAFESKDLYNFLADGQNTSGNSIASYGNNNVYMIGSGQIAGGDYRWFTRRSTDKGVTWTSSAAFQLYTTDPDMSSTDGKATSYGYDITTDSSGNIYAVGQANFNYISKWVVRKSTDEGATWTTVDEFEHQSGYAASAYTVHITSSGAIFVGGTAKNSTGDFWIVRKSIDAGASWTTVDAVQPAVGTFENVARDIASTTNEDIYVSGVVEAGTQKYHYVRKSTDGGATWTVVDAYYLAVNAPARGTSLAITSTGIIYAIASVEDGAARKSAIIRKSTNSGASFSTVYSYDVAGYHFTIASIAVDTNNNVFLTGFYESIDTGYKPYFVSKSVDAGVNFYGIDSNVGAGQGIQGNRIKPCMTDRLCVVGTFFTSGYNNRSFIRILSE